jgi:hypothetical protein
MFVHYLKVEWTFLLFEYTACSLVALHSTMLECHPNPCGPCGPEKLVNLYAVYVLWSTYKQNLYIKFGYLIKYHSLNNKYTRKSVIHMDSPQNPSRTLEINAN